MGWNKCYIICGRQTNRVDFFICKDGFSSLRAADYSKLWHEITKQASEKVVTNKSVDGGWFMLSAKDLGEKKKSPSSFELLSSSKTGRKLERWLEDLTTRKLMATVPVTASEEKMT